MGKVLALPGPPKPPAGLSKPALEFWQDLQKEYGIGDAGGLKTLELAARAFDRLEEARGILDKEGCVFKDRWGQPRPHPATQVERDTRAGLLRALQLLHLDVEPLAQNRIRS